MLDNVRPGVQRVGGYARKAGSMKGVSSERFASDKGDAVFASTNVPKPVVAPLTTMAYDLSSNISKRCSLAARTSPWQIRNQDFEPRFFNLTPGAPPLMNSMPAPSRARFSAVIVELWATKTPGFDSRRFIVGRETDEAFAKWRCSQRKRALAARISSLVSQISFMLTIPVALFDT
jgi:hypothetical protein